MIRCNVCGSKDTRALYRSHSENSITTMNVTIKGETEVFVCNGCSHVQTKPLVNLKKFYEIRENMSKSMNIQQSKNSYLHLIKFNQPLSQGDKTKTCLI